MLAAGYKSSNKAASVWFSIVPSGLLYNSADFSSSFSKRVLETFFKCIIYPRCVFVTPYFDQMHPLQHYQGHE